MTHRDETMRRIRQKVPPRWVDSTDLKFPELEGLRRKMDRRNKKRDKSRYASGRNMGEGPREEVGEFPLEDIRWEYERRLGPT